MKRKNVCVIGTGYVGLVTGTCLAEIGHRVVCVDRDESKIKTLLAGRMPIYEPGLDRLVRKNVRAGRLTFTTNLKDGVSRSQIVFIAVNTPSLPDGGADLSFVEACTREVAAHADRYKLLVEKSTVPVQTGQRIKKTLELMREPANVVDVASNPEFLREGTAVHDFLKPDRIVVGVQTRRAEKLLRELYAPIKAPLVVTDINSAELIKHASNSFLSVKISYINAIARICDRVGADVHRVAEGMGLDRRIGKSFLSAGIGYGGSCFPKDVAAFIKIAEANGYDFEMLKATERINREQRALVIRMLEEELWTVKDKTVAVWGLSFKPNTDDLRNAPALDVLHALMEGGARVRAHDPVAMQRMKEQFPEAHYARTAEEAARGSDALVLLTEWDLYRRMSPKKIKSLLRTPVVVDGRNAYDPAAMAKAGVKYRCIGRASAGRT